MVVLLGLEEGRGGDRILSGSLLALPGSADLCSRLTPTHEKLQSAFVGKQALHLGFPDPNDLQSFSHRSPEHT